MNSVFCLNIFNNAILKFSILQVFNSIYLLKKIKLIIFLQIVNNGCCCWVFFQFNFTKLNNLHDNYGDFKSKVIEIKLKRKNNKNSQGEIEITTNFVIHCCSFYSSIKFLNEISEFWENNIKVDNAVLKMIKAIRS